jgi:hypothetical protein
MYILIEASTLPQPPQAITKMLFSCHQSQRYPYKENSNGQDIVVYIHSSGSKKAVLSCHWGTKFYPLYTSELSFFLITRT